MTDPVSHAIVSSWLAQFARIGSGVSLTSPPKCSLRRAIAGRRWRMWRTHWGSPKGPSTGASRARRRCLTRRSVSRTILSCCQGRKSLPLQTPPPGATLAKLRLRLAEGVRDSTLAAALKSGRPDHSAAEFSAIVHDLYRKLERNRRSIKIVDRCALDQPDLAALWFGEGRQVQQAALARYLERRISEGGLRPLPNTEIAARVMLETIVFWAVHRHWDPEPQKVSEDQISSVLADLLLHGLARERM